LILAKIDKAVAAGDLTAAEAADLKTELDSTTLPGYKQSKGFFGLGFGSGGHDKGGFGGGGFGFDR
jgi:hypothetical protein